MASFDGGIVQVPKADGANGTEPRCWSSASSASGRARPASGRSTRRRLTNTYWKILRLGDDRGRRRRGAARAEPDPARRRRRASPPRSAATRSPAATAWTATGWRSAPASTTRMACPAPLDDWEKQLAHVLDRGRRLAHRRPDARAPRRRRQRRSRCCRRSISTDPSAPPGRPQAPGALAFAAGEPLGWNAKPTGGERRMTGEHSASARPGSRSPKLGVRHLGARPHARHLRLRRQRGAGARRRSAPCWRCRTAFSTPRATTASGRSEERIGLVVRELGGWPAGRRARDQARPRLRDRPLRRRPGPALVRGRASTALAVDRVDILHLHDPEHLADPLDGGRARRRAGRALPDQGGGARRRRRPRRRADRRDDAAPARLGLRRPGHPQPLHAGQPQRRADARPRGRARHRGDERRPLCRRRALQGRARTRATSIRIRPRRCARRSAASRRSAPATTCRSAPPRCSSRRATRASPRPSAA